jgi:DNA-binding NarL/FixJ family response regulator
MSSSTSIRVAVASDQAIYRRGLTTLILSIKNVQLVGEAQDVSDTLQLCELFQPNLILLDFKAPLDHGLNLAATIHQRWPQIIAILMVGTQDESQTYSPMGDATYYFSRDISESEFCAAIQHIGQARTSANGDGIADRAAIEEFEPPDKTPTSVYIAHSFDKIEDEEIRARELITAGKIQADILPEKPPSIPGWDICAKLESARETSGDFYDFIPLPNNNWGIVVADVTDKGIGAALFMALSSTLLRTYAARYPSLPALTMDAVNERIFSDTRGGMFVTTFFGVLEPHTGRFRYANAGHPPACLVSSQKGKKPVDRLAPTGMALGILPQAQWQQKIAKLYPGDVLLLYTDGITEAQNPQGSFFGERRLMEVFRSKSGCSAREIQETILAEVHRFVGGTPRQDDIAVIVIRREE